MKNILLTGGTGFIGSFLGYRFLQESHRVIFLARGSGCKPGQERIGNALRFVGPHTRFRNQYQVIEGDITKINLGIDSKESQRIGKIDEIWHAAASISFKGEEADKTHKVNVEGTRNVLKFATDMEIPRLHYLSTAYVAGDRLDRVYEDELDCGQEFRNSYERTKFEAEKLVREYYPNASIYRLGIVVGDSQTGQIPMFSGYYNFMRGFHVLKKNILRNLIHQNGNSNGSGIFVNGDGLLIVPARLPCYPRGTINIVNIDYVVNAIYSLSEYPESIGRTFHIVNQNPPQFAWLFNTGIKILGMNGFKLVNVIKNSIDIPISLPGVYTKEILKIESDILYACEEYLPYICGEPVFDTSNTEELLGDVLYPQITKKGVEILLKYALDTNFGKQSIPEIPIGTTIASSNSFSQQVALVTKATH